MAAEMLKILFFSDTHLGFDFPLRPRVEKERRGEDFFRNFETVLNTAKDEKVDAIIHGGDLFFRSRVSPLIVEKAFNSLHKVADSGIPIYLVPGNHERSWIPQNLFHQHKNIHIFDRPATFKLKKGDFTINLSGFPNVRNGIRSAFPGLLREINSTGNGGQFKILCFHQSVEGASVGPHNYQFKRDPDTIAAKDIPAEYDLILSGHIHRHQIISSNLNGNLLPKQVLYSGSTERTAFAEASEEKGYIKLEISMIADKKKVNYSWHFVKLLTRPMIIVEINLAHINENTNLRSIIEFQLRQLPKKANIKLKFNGEGSEDLIGAIVKKVQQIKPKQMIVTYPGNRNRPSDKKK